MNTLYTWGTIALLVITSSTGDVMIAAAMKRVGDLGELHKRRGPLHVAARVLTSPLFLGGIGCMTVSFFSLMFALSWADVSLVGPAAASLTFLSNAVAGHFFLRERVDRRRWAAAIFVAAGVALLAA